ncbi:MAG: polysaccharide biosynthesis C-terminal domain-containing protein [Flavobacteriales bacterium]|nr:polysaccharide biosynthesis C-terminal domain-containing protein [Flavobacteriales bacterium]MCC6937388.1 polysaccharide biosynthesis C-terminal domain-containing protein [Flavobacteriales bacterium]
MGIIARQATLNTLLAYLGIGLGFVNVVLLYPRVLAADEFGLTRLLVSIATIAAQVAQLGAENTVIRYFPYFRDPERKHRGLLGMLLLFGLVVGLASMLVLGLLHGTFTRIFADRNALYGTHGLLLLPLVFAEIYFILLRSYSRSLRRTVQPTFIREFVLRILQTALIALQAWHPMPFSQFMTLYTGIFLVCTLSLVFDLWRAGHFDIGWQERWLPNRLRKSMLTYSGFTLSAGLAGIILGNMDQLMIGALLGQHALTYVAHYAVAFYFGSVIAAPGRALLQAATPLLADAWKRNDRTMIDVLYRKSAVVQVLVSGFLFLVMWTSIDDLFELLPAEYAGASQVALVIGLAYLLTSAIGLSVGIISMSRSYRLDAWSSISMLVINLIANFFLIRSMGIIGAAYATLISLVVVNAYRTWFLWYRYKLWPFDRRTVLVAALIIVPALVLPWLPLTGNPWVDLPLRALIATVIFWPAAYVLKLMPDLLDFLKTVQRKAQR